MSKIRVTGGTSLKGSVRVPGAKNAVLPILAATLLTRKSVRLLDCPHLSDVENMIAILRLLGCKVEWDKDALLVDSSKADRWEMPEKLAKELRSSIFMLGPVVGRFKKAKFTYPGGCEIGNRPIDMHLKGLTALNVKIQEEHGFIICDGEDMHGANIHLDYPSVGATENIMMAAVTIPERTVIHNAAREPEIIDLFVFLQELGAEIAGAGTSTITIEGGKELEETTHTIIPDRISAGTLMVASAITAGDVTVHNVAPTHMNSVFNKLYECGCKIEIRDTFVRVIGPKRPKEIKLIETQPYPGFPTDMQAQILTLCTIAHGTSLIVENVFENRFKHAAELARMGADITVKDRMAIIRGVERLTGAEVNARDLRGGAALVLAGLQAEGETVVNDIHYIDRGYEKLEELLESLGANIKRC